MEGVVDGEDTQDVEQDGAHGEPQAELIHLSPAGGRLLLTAVGEHQQRQNDGGEQLRGKRPSDHGPHLLLPQNRRMVVMVILSQIGGKKQEKIKPKFHLRRLAGAAGV